jgi:hypothetical protein
MTDPFRFVVVGAPAYLARHGTPERPEDLLRHERITFRSQTTRRDKRSRLASRLDAPRRRIRARASEASPEHGPRSPHRVPACVAPRDNHPLCTLCYESHFATTSSAGKRRSLAGRTRRSRASWTALRQRSALTHPCARGACTQASSRAGAGLLPTPPGSCECGAFASSLASHPRPSR